MKNLINRYSAEVLTRISYAKSSPANLGRLLSNGNLTIAPHIKLLNEKLQDVANGKIKRLIVNMPPRHGKTEMISKYFPIWYLGRNPNNKIIIAAYQGDLAEEWGEFTKTAFETYGQTLFNLKMNKSSKSKKRWRILNHDGGLQATGVRGALTGKGANVLIIDDPIKDDLQAMSLTYRDRIFNWFRATASTRLAKDGAIIIVMTRWHYDDLCGRILNDEADKWEVLSLPAIAINDNDIIGRKEGEALFPQLFPIDDLLDKKRSTGNFWFSALYQQQPIAGEYQIFSPYKWMRYNVADLDNQTFVRHYQVWDTAFKDGDYNDYSVCATWAVNSKGDMYLIDIWRGKPLFPEMLKRVMNQYEIYKPYMIGIEDAGSGQDLIATLKSRTKLKIRPIRAMKKITRAHFVSALIEDGRVYIPNTAPWLEAWLTEHNNFPADKHDDQVDSTTMSLELMQKFANSLTNQSSSSAITDRRERRVKRDKFQDF